MIHRDIKPQNILVTKDGKLKLCDLEFIKNDGSSFKSKAGTEHYMAPEMKVSEKYSNKVDIYSLGKTILQLYKKGDIGSLPEDVHILEDMKKKCPLLHEISVGCLKNDPMKRLSSQSILFLIWKHQKIEDVMLINVLQKDSKEFVLEAVKKNGNSLCYASKELRNDKEIVLEAVKKNGNSLSYASKELRNDKEFVLQLKKIINIGKEHDISLLQEFKNTIQNMKDMFTVDTEISYNDGINWKAFKKMERWNRFYKLKITDNDGKIQVGTIPKIHTTTRFQKEGMKTKLEGNEYCAMPIFFVYGEDESDIQQEVKGIIDKYEDGAYIGAKSVGDWNVGDILFQGAHLWSLKGKDGDYYVFVMEGYDDDDYLLFSFAKKFHSLDLQDDYVQLMNHKFANFDKRTREESMFENELTILDENE